MQSRLSTRVKLGYGVADVGASLSFVAINTWLLYFLINIMDIRPLQAGLIFILGRILDAFLDPLMGVISDRLKGRFGRILFIRWGAIPLGLCFALLWFVPGGPQSLKFVLALVIFMLFSIIYTVVQVPYMALTPEIAPSYDERTSLTSFRMGFGTLASMLAVALPPIIVLAFSANKELAQSAPSGWLMTGLVFGFLCSLAYLIMAFSVKEPKVKGLKSSTSFFAEYRSAFSIFGFKEVFFMFIVVTIGIMVINSILPFYLESSLRLEASQQPLILGSLFGVAILSFPIWNAVAARLGKRYSLVLGLSLMALGVLFLVLFSQPGSISTYLMIMTVVTGIGFSAVILFPWAMLPDVVEFDELQTGQRREGLVYALFTFGQKLAGSIGVFSNALMASLFGYQQGIAEQTAETVWGIKLMAGPVSALIFLIAIIFVLRFPITKAKHQAAKQDLIKKAAQ